MWRSWVQLPHGPPRRSRTTLSTKTNMNLTTTLAVMIKAAQAGGRQTVRFFGKRFTERDKAFGDVVTQADLAADEKIVSLLRRHFPAYNIISEERDEINNGSRYTFVIDPLDGTAT